MSDDEPSVHFNCSSTPLTLLIRSSVKGSQSMAGLRSTGSVPASVVGVTAGVVTAGVLGPGEVGPDDVVVAEQSSPLQSSLSSHTAPMTQSTTSTTRPATRPRTRGSLDLRGPVGGGGDHGVVPVSIWVRSSGFAGCGALGGGAGAWGAGGAGAGVGVMSVSVCPSAAAYSETTQTLAFWSSALRSASTAATSRTAESTAMPPWIRLVRS